MAVEINWKILSLKVRNDYLNLQNMIVRVEWNCTAKYTENNGIDELNGTGSVQGETFLGVPDSNYFIPLEQLTEAQIISWAHQVMGNKVKETEILATRHAIGVIHSEANLVPVPLPWANV